MVILFALTLLISGTTAIVSGTVWFVRSYDQREHDSKRQTYLLRFPSELKTDDVLAWVHAIGGTLKTGPMRFFGVPSIVFEVESSGAGIVHRLHVPSAEADYVISQLWTLVPGIRIKPEQSPETKQWDKVIELGHSAPSRTLRINDVEKFSTTILGTLRAMGHNEAVAIQIVVSPAVPEKPPPSNTSVASHETTVSSILHGHEAGKDEIADRRAKLSEPNMLAVIRIASRAQTAPRALHLVMRAYRALASARSPHTRFKLRKHLTRGMLLNRMLTASAPIVYPTQLTATELSALIAWPIQKPNIIGLPRFLGRQFPPVGTVPDKGIVIGHSTFPGAERPIAVGFREALMHAEILGETGTGKSVLLGHVGRQVMNAGYGLIVMEAAGNLYRAVLDYVPRHRIDDVILLDLSDRQYPVAFNILDQGSSDTVIDEIMDLFAHRYGMGVWSDEYILHGMRTLAENPDLTLMDLGPLLSPTADEVEWVNSITRRVKDAELKRWWQRHEHRGKIEQQKRADPVLSRISQMASRPELRYMLGQSQSAFRMSDVLTGNKILLVNLKGVSRDTASLAGTLIMQSIWHAVQTVKKELPTYLILDEYARFMDLPVDTETMLAESRKYLLGMWLAHQHMTQLKPSVRDGVITNARNKIVLASNANDARLLGPALHGDVSVEDITNLQSHEAIASVLTPTGSSGPISIMTLPPERPVGVAGQVRAMSRQKYARSITEVEAENNARRLIEPSESTHRAPIGVQEWIVKED
jgi:hypothetical protein